ncbi:hypothetical protein Pint_18388 [Pistacia integerrima]|uniref:Uncharacterized protein n=1 Tax=Pistacia integerrima TaxID=434235 RepID=A0ACC0Z002_9ROSI|nr:hypothetical protein Pint_18388 [Pistacia integerrima]
MEGLGSKRQGLWVTYQSFVSFMISINTYCAEFLSLCPCIFWLWIDNVCVFCVKTIAFWLWF